MSFPHSSIGLFHVMMVERFSYRLMINSKRCSPACGGSPDKAIKTMTEKIEAKGGKIVSSFYVRTKNASTNDIVNKTKEIAGQYSPGAAH